MRSQIRMSGESSSSFADGVALHHEPTVPVADAPADAPVALAARFAWDTSLSHRCAPMNLFLWGRSLFFAFKKIHTNANMQSKEEIEGLESSQHSMENKQTEKQETER